MKVTNTGREALHFSLNEKEHFIKPGGHADLPEAEPYVAGLLAAGVLTENTKKSTPTAAAAGTGVADK